jgi:hypothetical protein
MSTSQDVEPCCTTTDLADALINASGARRTDRVVIAGRGNLDLLVALCRRGYAHAASQAADQGPHIGGTAADVLLAPNISSETELTAVLSRLGRRLRDGGTLVVRGAHRLLDNRLRRLIADCGFTLTSRDVRADDGSILLCARKRAVAARARAA